MNEQVELLPYKKNSFKDELNFAEFPLASLSERVPKDVKTITFQDRIYDEGQRKEVNRKLTITASDKFGLPCADDDEVLLGLIQLTHQRGFQKKEVHFSRYELIKLLGWRDDTKNYARIEESLNKWLGVTLYYEKAWWSKEEKCWVDTAFHVIESLTLYDKDRIQASIRNGRAADIGRKLSSFTWNPEVFKSFEAGYLKEIDLDLFQRLNSTIAKRMYRFLDKRFYKTGTLKFDLMEFAFEKVGVSRKYKLGAVKRLLSGAIAELVEVGFLAPLDPEERFRKLRAKVWIVTFKCGKRKGEGNSYTPVEPERLSAIEEALMKRGVDREQATRLKNKYSEAHIQDYLEYFDFVKRKKEKAILQSPGGWLVSAIEKPFTIPDTFETSSQRKKHALLKAKRTEEYKKKEEAKREKLDARGRAGEDMVERFLSVLPTERQRSFEEEAVKEGQPFLRKQYHEEYEKRGPLFHTARQKLLEQHIRKTLGLKVES